MNDSNIAYFGTPDNSASVLESLLQSEIGKLIKLVITHPDKKQGKRLQMKPSPVKSLALRHNIALADFELHKSNISLIENYFKEFNIHIGLVYAYGSIIPDAILTLLPIGCMNIHPSLLPLYRGPSPIRFSLLLGDMITGVTLMKIVSELDAGPIISQQPVDIDLQDNVESLTKKLHLSSVQMVRDSITNIKLGLPLKSKAQNHKKATYTTRINKDDGYIPLPIIEKCLRNENIKAQNLPPLHHGYAKRNNIALEQLNNQSSAQMLWNYYRALSAWPGIWTRISTAKGVKRLKLTELLYSSKRLTITKVQLEGKNEVDFTTFNRAYSIFD